MARTGEVQMCSAVMKSFQRCFSNDIGGLSLLFTAKKGGGKRLEEIPLTDVRTDGQVFKAIKRKDTSSMGGSQANTLFLEARRETTALAKVC